MMEASTFIEAFKNPEYLKFKELVHKSSGDGSVKLVRGNIEYGKHKAKVPAFIDAAALQDKLYVERVSLLMTFSDLHDKIIISDDPILYKKQYECVVAAIEKVDATLDQLNAYVATVYEETIVAPLTALEAALEDERLKALMLTSTLQDTVHVPKKKAQDLAAIHKRVMNLLSEISQAKMKPNSPFVIWDENNGETNCTKEVRSRSRSSASATPTSSSKRLSVAKKAAIKQTTKRTIVEKLGTP